MFDRLRIGLQFTSTKQSNQRMIDSAAEEGLAIYHAKKTGTTSYCSEFFDIDVTSVTAHAKMTNH